jgi:hypothetical protein
MAKKYGMAIMQNDNGRVTYSWEGPDNCLVSNELVIESGYKIKDDLDFGPYHLEYIGEENSNTSKYRRVHNG